MPQSRPSRIPYALKTLILAASLWSPGADAATGADPDASNFSVSGFGSLGIVHSSEGGADFTDSFLQPNGAGYTQSWSPDVDSRLGAQVTAHFTPHFSAMLQVISEQNYDDTFTPHVEWANIAYQPKPDISVRLGRIVLPTFLLSDTRKVGFANPWVRPPVEVYALSPVVDSDGADASYKLHEGDLVNTLVGTYGKTRFGVPPSSTLEARDLWVLADTLEYEQLTLHLAYQSSIYKYDGFDALFEALRQFGEQGSTLANKYDPENKRSQLITAGAMYDPGKWFVTGEWGRRNLHSSLGKESAWYLSGGYRLAKFTPYLTYSETNADSNTFDRSLTLSALPPSLAGPTSSLNADLNKTLANAAVQNTFSFGSRWDVLENVDLKLQYDHIDLGAGSSGTLINLQPAFQRGGTVNLLSLAIDFVW